MVDCGTLLGLDVAICRILIYYHDSRYTVLDSRDDQKSEIDEA